MSNLKVHWMSKRQDWGTPREFMSYLSRSLCIRPTLDVSADHHNAKALEYYTEADNGLEKPWNGVVWCNPPYENQKAWIEKALLELENYDRCYFLIPCRPDTRYFHDLIWPNASRIWLIKGRMNFVSPHSVKGGNAPFPSMLVQFGGTQNSYCVGPSFGRLTPTAQERGW